MIPAVFAQAGRVTQPALNLVGQHGRGNQLAADCLGHIAHGEDGGQVVAGVCRFQGQVSIVVVKVADEQAVDEGGPLGRTAAAAEQPGPGLPLDPPSTALGNGVSIGLHGSHGRGEGVDEASLRLMNDRCRQVFKGQGTRVLRQAIGERLGHEILLASTGLMASAPESRKGAVWSAPHALRRLRPYQAQRSHCSVTNLAKTVNPSRPSYRGWMKYPCLVVPAS